MKYRIRGAREDFVWRFKQLGATPNFAAILVCGNQKSGTSAVGHLLSLASGEAMTADFRVSPTYLRNLHNAYTGRLSIPAFVQNHRLEFSRQIVKEPSLTFIASGLLDYLTGARAVAVVRDPRNNIRSLLSRLNIRGDLRNLPADAGLSAAWVAILNNQGLGLPGGHYIEKLAHRWNAATEGSLGDGRVAVVKYEDFLADKRSTIESLCALVRLPVRNDITPYLDIQYQPRGRDVGWEEFFGAENLSVIEATCRDGMERLGYT